MGQRRAAHRGHGGRRRSWCCSAPRPPRARPPASSRSRTATPTRSTSARVRSRRRVRERHEDPARLRSRGARAARARDHSNVVARGTGARAARVAMADHGRAPGHPLHDASAGRHRAARATAATRSQLYADAPGRPADHDQERAARTSTARKPGRAQAAGYRVAHLTTSAGATRIVQRVDLRGRTRSARSCSARGSNYIRTYKAEVGIVDVLAPTASILADTPLARGEWVGGSQPLNYDASDNVGVRSGRKRSSRADRVGSSSDGRAPSRSSGGDLRRPACRARTARVRSASTRRRLPEGTQPLVVQAQDTAGNLANSRRGDGADRQHTARPRRRRR